MATQTEADGWHPIPDEVAIILGQITFYASWLDDMVGECVTQASSDIVDSSEATPGWASSGTQLVAALRRIELGEPKVNAAANQLADHLSDLNGVRNQLIHGVWMWEGDSVMVMKRSLGPGQRSVDYARYTYAELRAVVTQIQVLGRLAERFAGMLPRMNPVHALRQVAVAPICPVDEVSLEGALVDDVILWQCGVCGLSQPSAPIR